MFSQNKHQINGIRIRLWNFIPRRINHFCLVTKLAQDLLPVTESSPWNCASKATFEAEPRWGGGRLYKAEVRHVGLWGQGTPQRVTDSPRIALVWDCVCFCGCLPAPPWGWAYSAMRLGQVLPVRLTGLPLLQASKAGTPLALTSSCSNKPQTVEDLAYIYLQVCESSPQSQGGYP